MAERFSEPEATLIVALLDESGSMALKQADVIGGFNTFLTEQARGPDPARLMLLKFNTTVTLLLEATPIEKVDPLTKDTYRPSGNTALYDAVIEAIRQGTAQRRPTDRVLMVIVTDGEENSSRTATLDVVKTAITTKQKDGDWTFIYLGPDPEKWAQQTGTFQANTTQYVVSKPAETFVGLSNSLGAYRASAAWASDDTQIEAAVRQSTTNPSPTP